MCICVQSDKKVPKKYIFPCKNSEKSIKHCEKFWSQNTQITISSSMPPVSEQCHLVQGIILQKI